MKQIKAKNEVKKAKTKGKQEGEEVMKKRNWVIMMSAAALAMASVTGCSSQNGGETTAKVENAGGSKDGASAAIDSAHYRNHFILVCKTVKK